MRQRNFRGGGNTQVFGPPTESECAVSAFMALPSLYDPLVSHLSLSQRGYFPLSLPDSLLPLPSTRSTPPSLCGLYGREGAVMSCHVIMSSLPATEGVMHHLTMAWQWYYLSGILSVCVCVPAMTTHQSCRYIHTVQREKWGNLYVRKECLSCVFCVPLCCVCVCVSQVTCFRGIICWRNGDRQAFGFFSPPSHSSIQLQDPHQGHFSWFSGAQRERHITASCL